MLTPVPLESSMANWIRIICISFGTTCVASSTQLLFTFTFKH